MQWLNRLQRRVFGRCTYCKKPIDKQHPYVWGYEWKGWLASEGGLYHAYCLDRAIHAPPPRLRQGRPRNGYGQPMQLRGV